MLAYQIKVKMGFVSEKCLYSIVYIFICLDHQLLIKKSI